MKKRVTILVSLLFCVLFSAFAFPTVEGQVHVVCVNQQVWEPMPCVSSIPAGEKFSVMWKSDPGYSGVAMVYVRSSSSVSHIWQSAPISFNVGGSTRNDGPVPGISTPGSYVAGVAATLSTGTMAYDEMTFSVAAAGPAFDFSLALSPSSVSVKQGDTANYQISITYSDPSYSGTTITVQVVGLGPGMNYQIIPSPPSLSISTSQSTPTGSYTITLTGSANGMVHQTSATLVVQPAITRYAIDWALSNPSLSPSSPNVGDPVTFNVALTQTSSDWPGSLSVGVKVQLDSSPFDTVWIYQNQPGPIPVGTTETASTKPWTATAGTHSVTWTLLFFGGDETVILADPTPNDDNASLQFSVVAQAPDFRIDVSPPSQSVTQGQTTSYAVHITGLNGFNSQVSLTIAGLPSGVSGTFSVPSSTPDYSSTLTLTLPGNSPTGSFTLSITGSGGGLTRDANVILMVNPSQTQSQTTSTQTTTSSAGGLLGALQQNSLIVIGLLVLLVILLAALAMRSRGGGRAAPQQSGAPGVFCGKCGTENPASNEFCGSCGNKLKSS
jgi:hypothetical protein